MRAFASSFSKVIFSRRRCNSSGWHFLFDGLRHQPKERVENDFEILAVQTRTSEDSQLNNLRKEEEIIKRKILKISQVKLPNWFMKITRKERKLQEINNWLIVAHSYFTELPSIERDFQVGRDLTTLSNRWWKY